MTDHPNSSSGGDEEEGWTMVGSDDEERTMMMGDKSVDVVGKAPNFFKLRLPTPTLVHRISLSPFNAISSTTTTRTTTTTTKLVPPHQQRPPPYRCTRTPRDLATSGSIEVHHRGIATIYFFLRCRVGVFIRRCFTLKAIRRLSYQCLLYLTHTSRRPNW